MTAGIFLAMLLLTFSHEPSPTTTAMKAVTSTMTVASELIHQGLLTNFSAFYDDGRRAEDILALWPVAR